MSAEDLRHSEQGFDGGSLRTGTRRDEEGNGRQWRGSWGKASNEGDS